MAASGRIVCAICLVLAGVACKNEGISDEPLATNMTTTQTPYETTANIWRDEQPGDEPSMHTSIQLTPREGEKIWEAVKLDTIRMKLGDKEWKPNRSAIESLPGGGLEIRADGEATMLAGSKVSVLIQLDTAQGQKTIEVSESVIDAIE